MRIGRAWPKKEQVLKAKCTHCGSYTAVGCTYSEPHPFRYMFITLLLFVLVAGSISMMSDIACAADVYLVAGTGEAKHQLNGNGVWYQEGFDHKIQSNSPAWRLGAGWQITDWLAVEGLAHDFGRTHISADFVLNDDNYNPRTPNHCNGRCNPLVHGEGEGHAKGFSLSFLPSQKFNRDWSVYARGGLLWWKRSWEERLTCCAPGTRFDGEPYGPRLHETFSTISSLGMWNGDGPDVKPNNSGQALLWGLGMQFKSFRFEYNETRGIHALGSGHTNLGTITIDYQLRF